MESVDISQNYVRLSCPCRITHFFQLPHFVLYSYPFSQRGGGNSRNAKSPCTGESIPARMEGYRMVIPRWGFMEKNGEFRNENACGIVADWE